MTLARPEVPAPPLGVTESKLVGLVPLGVTADCVMAFSIDMLFFVPYVARE